MMRRRRHINTQKHTHFLYEKTHTGCDEKREVSLRDNLSERESEETFYA